MSSIQINAADTAVSLVGPGTQMVTQPVPAGQLAVVLSTVDGTNVYVYGTAQTLRDQVLAGLSAPIPADVPLFDDEPGSLNGVRVVFIEDERS